MVWMLVLHCLLEEQDHPAYQLTLFVFKLAPKQNPLWSLKPKLCHGIISNLIVYTLSWLEAFDES